MVSGVVVRDGWWLVSGLIVKAVGGEQVCWLVSGHVVKAVGGEQVCC